MRTFDIALKYLKEIDFKDFDMDSPECCQSKKTISKKEELINTQIEVQHEKFKADPDNTKSNDWYRSMTFMTAVLHLIFKAHGVVSFFDVACEIIESDIHIVDTKFKPYLRTAYPEVMVKKWKTYCEGLKSKTVILEGECRESFFFTAYHYIVEPKKA